MEWKSATELAIATDFGDGATFVPGTDVPGSLFTSVPQALIPIYNTNGDVDLAMVFTGVSSSVGTRWVLADFGFYNSGLVVDFNTDATTAIGFGYRSRLQLLRPETDISQGYALGMTRRIDQVAMLLFRTGPLFIGTDFTDVLEHRFDIPNDPTTPQLFSGVYQTTITSAYDFDNEIAIEQTRPVPGSILAVSGFLTTNER
jgi:hypothetical protein